jgi:hypothetical protein
MGKIKKSQHHCHKKANSQVSHQKISTISRIKEIARTILESLALNNIQIMSEQKMNNQRLQEVQITAKKDQK